MGRGIRALLCESTSFVFLIPSLSSISSSQLSFFKTVRAPKLRRMATEASSSPSSLTSSDGVNPPAPSPSASSAIDFLTLCHRLKVIFFPCKWISFWDIEKMLKSEKENCEFSFCFLMLGVYVYFFLDD